jgi:hypothetical protein
VVDVETVAVCVAVGGCGWLCGCVAVCVAVKAVGRKGVVELGLHCSLALEIAEEKQGR